MHTVALKLVTIVGEPVLAETLIRKLQELGATGYTIGEVRGRGSRGIRPSELPGDNVRIETVVSASVADRILEVLATNFFPSYAVVAWAADVEVVRGEKYA
jgi:nitrogen regulatory protein P-II 2